MSAVEGMKQASDGNVQLAVVHCGSLCQQVPHACRQERTDYLVAVPAAVDDAESTISKLSRAGTVMCMRRPRCVIRLFEQMVAQGRPRQVQCMCAEKPERRRRRP